MKLPDVVAGVGAKCTLVLLDRVIECQLSAAHVNAIIKNVAGNAEFVDDELLCKFKIVKATQIDTSQAGAVHDVIQRTLHDRGARSIDLE